MTTQSHNLYATRFKTFFYTYDDNEVRYVHRYHYVWCYLILYSGKFSLGAIFHEQVQIREIKHPANNHAF